MAKDPKDNLEIPEIDDLGDLETAGDFNIPTGLDDLLLESSQKKLVVGSWGFPSHTHFARMSSEETNVWFFEQVFNFLRAFFGLVVPDHMEVITYNASKQVKKENLNQMTFLDELMLVMKNLKESLWVIRLHLNIVGFLRSEWDPDHPVRVQIQEPANFVVWGGPDETGFQTLSISYNLFSDQKLKGENAMIWSINQPLLAKALKKWERQSGRRIEVVKGNSKDLSLSSSGFRKPAPTSAKPTTPSPPKSTSKPTQEKDLPSLEEDAIPNLDDLDL